MVACVGGYRALTKIVRIESNPTRRAIAQVAESVLHKTPGYFIFSPRIPELAGPAHSIFD